ncbi:hypothetical protein Tco_1167427, partial [Tanacetum coccineum]
MIPGGIAILTALVESDNEVKVVFDETPNLRILTSGKDGSDKGYGTNSLLEQRRDSYPDNDDYDPYDDDMYENHDMSEHLQSICDDLDITFWLQVGSGTEVLRLKDLQNFHTFCPEEINLASKVMLPSLETLEVSKLNSVEELWSRQLPTIHL